MKSSEYFIKFINDTIPVDIDYKKIKENIIIDTKEDYSIISPKKNIKLGIIILTFALTVLALVLPFTIPNNISTPINDKPTYEIALTKNEGIINKYFDEFIAFGPRYGYTFSSLDMKIDFCNSEQLLKTEILSPVNAKKLETYEYESTYSKRKKYNFYLGIKDNKDIIVLKCQYQPYEELVFDLNIEKSLKNILLEFENKIGEKLTVDYLNGKDSGIYVDFIEQESKYSLKFILYYEGEMYKIIL